MFKRESESKGLDFKDRHRLDPLIFYCDSDNKKWPLNLDETEKSPRSLGRLSYGLKKVGGRGIRGSGVEVGVGVGVPTSCLVWYVLTLNFS